MRGSASFQVIKNLLWSSETGKIYKSRCWRHFQQMIFLLTNRSSHLRNFPVNFAKFLSYRIPPVAASGRCLSGYVYLDWNLHLRGFLLKHFVQSLVRKLFNLFVCGLTQYKYRDYPNLNKKFKTKLQTLENKCVRFCLQLDNKAHVGITEFKQINWFPVNYSLDNVSLQTCLSALMINVPYTWETSSISLA